jgi:hypothetical protein
MSVLLTIQLTMPVKVGVLIVGLIIFTMGAFVVLFIREPVLKSRELPTEECASLLNEERIIERKE